MIFDSIYILEYLAVFVRISVCLMLLPGFSAAQVAIQTRLFVAITLSTSIFLMVHPVIDLGNDVSTVAIVKLVAGEMVIGAVFAIPVRFLFLALSFLGESLTQMIGLNPIPGTPIGDNQASTTLSSLMNVTALVLFFSTGLHLSFVMGLAGSFYVLPPGIEIAPGIFIENTVQNLGLFFNTVIRLGSPIIIYAVIVNFIAGLVNKLTPQIPVYFVSTPFLICGGLVFLAAIGDDIVVLFIREVDSLIGSLF